jgi:hypothetical protein
VLAGVNLANAAVVMFDEVDGLFLLAWIDTYSERWLFVSISLVLLLLFLFLAFWQMIKYFKW